MAASILLLARIVDNIPACHNRVVPVAFNMPLLGSARRRLPILDIQMIRRTRDTICTPRRIMPAAVDAGSFASSGTEAAETLLQRRRTGLRQGTQGVVVLGGKAPVVLCVL